MEKVRIKLFFAAILMMFSMNVMAQSQAAKIKEIQKDRRTYISESSTDPNEDAAFENARKNLITVARNFVSTNKDGAFISDDDIMASSEKIVTKRGSDFVHVFLYAKRDDLLAKGSSAESVTPQPSEVQEVVVDEDDDEADDEEAVEALPIKPSAVEESAPKVHVPTDEELHEEVAVIDNAVNSTAEISVALGELIDKLHSCSDLMEATEILKRYKVRRVVVAYGSPRETKNALYSYWVVDDNGMVTVLGPEVRGYRHNFRTKGKDALHNYRSGVWFRNRASAINN